MTRKNNTAKKIALFAGIIMVPAFFICLFAYGANHVFEKLPYYGPQTIAYGDTTEYVVPPFEFTDHLGNIVNNETLKGKVYLMTTATESCPENCPMQINQVYKYIYEKIKGSNETAEIVLVTHVISLDSTKPDAQKVIKDLPFEHGKDIDFKRWMFVYGDENPIYDVEIEGRGNSYQQFSDDAVGRRKSNHLIYLVDHDGHIRGFFPARSNPTIMEAERLAALLCIQKRKDDKGL